MHIGALPFYEFETATHPFARNSMRSLTLGLSLAFAVTATLAQDRAALQRGESLLAKDCSRCHAVGRSGASPHPQAPTFRSLRTRYPIEALQEALAEGIVSGHPDMPEFRFSAQDVGAIIAYLNSIQEP